MDKLTPENAIKASNLIAVRENIVAAMINTLSKINKTDYLNLNFVAQTPEKFNELVKAESLLRKSICSLVIQYYKEWVVDIDNDLNEMGIDTTGFESRFEEKLSEVILKDE